MAVIELNGNPSDEEIDAACNRVAEGDTLLLRLDMNRLSDILDEHRALTEAAKDICNTLRSFYLNGAPPAFLAGLAALSSHVIPCDATVPGTCRHCGCVDSRACADGCHWIDANHTLCSSPACVHAELERAATHTA